LQNGGKISIASGCAAPPVVRPCDKRNYYYVCDVELPFPGLELAVRVSVHPKAKVNGHNFSLQVYAEGNTSKR
jgi:hypothetical protein